jgi:hypothetical protein
MHSHPEADGEMAGINNLVSEMSSVKVKYVWCEGCEDFRPVNEKFVQFLQGRIESCSKCRK